MMTSRHYLNEEVRLCLWKIKAFNFTMMSVCLGYFSSYFVSENAGAYRVLFMTEEYHYLKFYM